MGGANLELAKVALAIFAVLMVGIVVVWGGTIGWGTSGKRLTTHYLLLTTHYLLTRTYVLTTHYSLLTAHYLLPTSYVGDLRQAAVGHAASAQ